ncbi:MAG TPA: hypothetical protein PK624_02955 [Spirochaetota bacterium]|nr:hypothetical protein [Spirochaetota bacterium]HOR43735.1 hypothetical protein [Spirochaetota bacterium]HOU85566.1 hypothetical protein [Spirochaetota bacterium]HPK55258.1 hypothetical protein [Spirochaetota bacterium]
MNKYIIEIEARINKKMFNHIAAIFSKRHAEIESYHKNEENGIYRICIEAPADIKSRIAIKDLMHHNDIISVKSYPAA